MKIFLLCIGFYVALVVFGQVSVARSADDVIPELPQTVVETPRAVAVDRGAQLVSDWMVEPHFSKTGVPSGSCVMTAQYDNGLEVAFKNKGNQLSAMRLRGFASVPETPIIYVGLEFDKKAYGLQSRTTNQQIDASLLSVPAPGQAISDLDSYSIRIGESAYTLSTYGFADAFEDLIDCGQRYGGTTLAVVSEPISVMSMIRGNERQAMPADPVADVVVEDGGEPQALMPELDAADGDDSGEGVGVDINDSSPSQWSAKKGERLKDVLSRWASDAGVALNVNIDKNPMIPNDFSITGTLENAVVGLLATMPKMAHINASMQTEESERQIVAATEKSMTTRKTDATSRKTERWRALQGTNLRKVLQRWSVSENIDFIWDADQEFMVRKSINETTEFSNAVAMLIAQYENQDVRPQATLNEDPDTGKTALIITSSINE